MTIVALILLICVIGQIIVCFCIIRNYKRFCKNLPKPKNHIEKQAFDKFIKQKPLDVLIDFRNFNRNGGNKNE